MNTIVKEIFNYVIVETNQVIKKLKNSPNQAYIGIGRPMHKLTPRQVVIARIVLVAIIAGLEIAIEKE